MADTLNVPARRHRRCGSGALPCDSLLPSIGATAAPLADIVNLFNSKVNELTDDEEHEEYLACPFWKHNPARYLRVKNSCTAGVGFKNIGKLTEHIKRVHCLWNGCEKCLMRFNKTKKEEVGEIKRRHMANCTQPTKSLTELDAEWMDKDQDEAYGQLNFQKDKGSPSQCYKKICCALWGPDPKIEIQGPYHLPGFQMSVLRWQFVKGLESLYEQKKAEEPRPDARQNANTAAAAAAAATTTTAFSPNIRNVDPMLLSTHTLNNLSSEPPPFYRGHRRKDSGVWSWDPSENHATFAKPTLPEFSYDDELDEENPARAQNEPAYLYTAGTWAGLAESYVIPDGQFDRDADGDVSWQILSE
ncbi:hypothetical protein F4813DRAFT_346976 [Daldinia decipiens]|uniref:uncharacterized protein n=1 Tax=Daldinia decipiens TaxID=326647 RepID=UPI0020C20F99|nr:uncharacterized protein F4813DRAFT_346976 [Daldinia decipiens]KAI1661268.1 hypothetical protein F4813DRAFT_346976 [Daldinia decipiens]